MNICEIAPLSILNIDEETCKIFGKERGRLRAAGLMIGDCDLLIGATALRHNLTLLTNNRRHFERIEGLRLEAV
jgi:tRNA(fMet)-specific endonuclease VapC